MSADASILIVEDESSALAYTKSLLEMDNYFVETAKSAIEALKRVQNGPGPSLILIKFAQRGMNRLEIIEECKTIYPNQKIILLSWPAVRVLSLRQSLEARQDNSKPRVRSVT